MRDRYAVTPLEARPLYEVVSQYVELLCRVTRRIIPNQTYHDELIKELAGYPAITIYPEGSERNFGIILMGAKSATGDPIIYPRATEGTVPVYELEFKNSFGEKEMIHFKIPQTPFKIDLKFDRSPLLFKIDYGIEDIEKGWSQGELASKLVVDRPKIKEGQYLVTQATMLHVTHNTTGQIFRKFKTKYNLKHGPFETLMIARQLQSILSEF